MADQKSFLVQFIRNALSSESYPNLFYLDDSMSSFVFLHRRSRYSPDDGEDYVRIFQNWSQMLKNKILCRKIPNNEAAPLIFVLKRSPFFTLISMDRDKYVFKFNAIEGYPERKRKAKKTDQSATKKEKESNDPLAVKSGGGTEIAERRPENQKKQSTKENKSNETLKTRYGEQTAGRKQCMKQQQNQMKQTTTKDKESKELLNFRCSAKTGTNRFLKQQQNQSFLPVATTAKEANVNVPLKSMSGIRTVGRNPFLRQQQNQMKQTTMIEEGNEPFRSRCGSKTARRKKCLKQKRNRQTSKEEELNVPLESICNIKTAGTALSLKKKKNQVDRETAKDEGSKESFEICGAKTARRNRWFMQKGNQTKQTPRNQVRNEILKKSIYGKCSNVMTPCLFFPCRTLTLTPLRLRK